MKPKTLRQALDAIQEMLDGQPFSADLWDVLVALRGPDSRDRKIKNATTALIRSKAFPKQPCLERSIFAHCDTPELARRRQDMFKGKQDLNHFREHIASAFTALDLQIGGVNDIQADPN